MNTCELEVILDIQSLEDKFDDRRKYTVIYKQ